MGNSVSIIQICYAPPKSVRVVNTDGTVLICSPHQVLTVADVLQSHPHHYLTEASQEREFSRGSMLRGEEFLQPGRTYIIHPLPRLFNVQAKKRLIPRTSISSCWNCITTGGFSVSDSFSDDNNDGHWQQMDVGLPASLIAMENSLAELKNSPMKTTRSPSAPSLDMQKLLKSAEIEWKEIADLSKTWRPDLESIKEESMKSLPPRQTLAELMNSQKFLASLRGTSEAYEERG